MEIGHRSITVAHLGVISIRLGGLKLLWDPEAEKFSGTNAQEANKWFSRKQRKPYTYDFI